MSMEETLCPTCGAYWQCDCRLDLVEPVYLGDLNGQGYWMEPVDEEVGWVMDGITRAVRRKVKPEALKAVGEELQANALRRGILITDDFPEEFITGGDGGGGNV